MGIFDRFKQFLSVERSKDGVWSYWLKESAFGSNIDYLHWTHKNPVLQTIISLRCKLYAQMQITAVNEKGEAVDSDFVKRLMNPNYFQSKHDFFYQQMWFMSAAGYNNTYQLRPYTNEAPKALYNLIPSKTDFKEVLKLSNFLSTQQEINAFEKKTVEYTLDRQKYNLPLRDIIPFYDLANALQVDSWCKAPSRIDGIREVLMNIEENIKSKNINLKMSQKYLASNKSSADGQPQIQPTDRSDIEEKLGRNDLHVTNANVDVTHLVKDLKNLTLDAMFGQDALSCLLAFEMNRDILNYSPNGASTYDNANAGLIGYIQNSIQPDADNTMNSFTNSWKLNEKGIKLVASYNHLPIMQTLVKDKIATLGSYSSMLNTNVSSGIISPADATKEYQKIKLDLGL